MKLAKKEQNKLNKQLFQAVENNDLEGVKAAVAAGADVNTKDKDGWTPLMDSISHFADIRIMDFLLEHGADPNLQNEYGGTALHYCFSIADTPKVRLLLEYNADMYIKNKDGHTPFAIALRWGEYDIAELYILNSYIPTEKDFNVMKDIEEQNKLKAQFMKLAQQVQNHKAKLDETNQVPCCDNNIMEF